MGGLAALVVAAGLVLRLVPITSDMWVDEAESSINALTILEHGLPVNHYLGLPMFEGMLFHPWTGHPEYEFRESAYSSRGVTVYHGWLPLYAMAGALWAAGIEPDKPVTPPRVLHTEREIRWRSAAPRIPSVIFALATMVLAFAAARDMAGPAAGWAALVLAAFWQKVVWLGWQARYYSATLAFSIAVAWLIWRTSRAGRWRDHLLLGVVLALLFHTHVLTCVVMGVLAAGASLPAIRRRGWPAFGRYAASAAILLAAAVPWVAWTRMLEADDGVPMARQLFDLEDLAAYPLSRLDLSVLLLGGMAVVGVAWWRARRGRAGARVREVANIAPPAPLLGGWCLLAIAGFMLLMPAGSYFFGRLTLMLVSPGLLLMAVILAGLARAAAPRHAAVLSVAGAVVFLLLSGRLTAVKPPLATGPVARQSLEMLRAMRFERDAKLYCTPNSHLVIMYYTGLPVQSIAPVRREFLERYEGPVYLFETFRNVPPPSPARVAELAAKAGAKLKPGEADEIAGSIVRHVVEDDLVPAPLRIEPALEPLPAYTRPLVEEQVALRMQRRARFAERWENWLVLRGYEVDTRRDWWQTYFYRFHHPERRRGDRANYVPRMKRADALMHDDATLVVYRSPGLKEGAAIGSGSHIGIHNPPPGTKPEKVRQD